MQVGNARKMGILQTEFHCKKNIRFLNTLKQKYESRIIHQNFT